MIRKVTLFMMLAVLAIGAGTAQAAMVYEAELLPAHVISGSEATAYGQATLIIDDGDTDIFLTLNFAGLDSPQVGASLLFASESEMGTVAMELPLGSPRAEVFDATPALVDALANDGLAIQVYSEFWPAGAIRGNFVFVTVATEQTSWTQVKTLFQ